MKKDEGKKKDAVTNLARQERIIDHHIYNCMSITLLSSKCFQDSSLKYIVTKVIVSKEINMFFVYFATQYPPSAFHDSENKHVFRSYGSRDTRCNSISAFRTRHPMCTVDVFDRFGAC